MGLSLERAGMKDAAIARYEHFLAGPPRLEYDAFKLVWVLEHVALLYDQKGDRKKARAAYERVVELWKNADPELQPRVARAREKAVALR
jgi:tetratricopeptide (TPR) repeat protein